MVGLLTVDRHGVRKKGNDMEQMDLRQDLNPCCSAYALYQVSQRHF